jgi:N-acetyl-anhydromuramyl-L-alanine amidase AmpD
MRCYMERELELVIVHCSATPPSMDIGVDEIRRWHLDRGWSDIGYHFVIRRDGTVEPGRPVSAVGAHAKGFNATSIGICLVGGVNDIGFADANYTRAQYDALERTLISLTRRGHVLAEQLGVDLIPPGIVGHRDLPGVTKACPCFDVRAWWNGGHL